MGKASSSKKVARAARAGGGASTGQPRSLLFPGVLLLIVVLGISLVVYARNDRNSDDVGGVPQLGDHIHQAFGINVCGEWKDPIPEFESEVGIHTHGDGVLHIHPFSQLGVGANATLGRFFQDAREGGALDVTLSDTKLTFLGETVQEGKTKCDGVDDPEFRMAYWADVADPDAKPIITTGDFTDRRLTDNGAGITIFYGDPKADIPKPPTAENLAALGAADGGQVPDANGNTTTSTAADGSTSTTTADGSTTSSTAATSSTTATTAG
jgi:hypothetical protein